MHYRRTLPADVLSAECPIDPQVIELVRENLMGCVGVDVNRFVDEKPRRANSVIIPTRGHDKLPRESPEAIAEAVARIQHHVWSTQEGEEDEREAIKFQIQVLVQRKGEPKPIKVTKSDLWYDGEEYVDGIFDDEDVDGARVVTPEVGALLRTCGIYERMLERLENMHAQKDQVFLDQQEKLVNLATAGRDALEQAMPVFLAGFQGQLEGEKLKYDERKAIEEVAASERKWKYLWDKAEKLPAMGKGLLDLASIASSMRRGPGGGPGGAPPPGPNGAPPQPPPPSSGPNTYAGAGADGQEEPPPFTEEQMNNPLATLVQAFHHSLTATQLRQLTHLLEGDELELWWSLCESVTDTDVRARYFELKSAAAMKLAPLFSFLDEIQQQQLQGVIATCEQPPPPPTPGPESGASVDAPPPAG